MLYTEKCRTLRASPNTPGIPTEYRNRCREADPAHNIVINACANAAEARTAQWQSKLEECKTEEERVAIQQIVRKKEVADLRRAHLGGVNTQVKSLVVDIFFALQFVCIQV